MNVRSGWTLLILGAVACGDSPGTSLDAAPEAPCTTPILTIDPVDPEVGDVVVVEAVATCEGATPELALDVRDPSGQWSSIRDWGPSPLAWNTAGSAAGTYQLLVGVRPTGTFGDALASQTADVALVAPPSPAFTVQMAGLGAGLVEVVPFGRCVTPGSCSFEGPVDEPVAAQMYPVGDSVWIGWSGDCTGSSQTCSGSVPGEVTATFAPKIDVDWVKSGEFWIDDVAWSGDHAVLVGTDSQSDRDLSIGFATSDGTITETVIDEDAARALDVEIDSTGAIVVTAAIGAANALSLRKYSSTGAPIWDVAPGGSAFGMYRTRPIALDVDDNSYVVGDDGAPYVASYTPAGTERWRLHPTTARLSSIAVRGELVAVGGDGWLGTFDRGGGTGWSRAMSTDVYDLAIDSDGDVVYAGRGDPLVVGAVAASGASVQWENPVFGWEQGLVKVRADDTVLLIGTSSLSLLSHREETGVPIADIEVSAWVHGAIETGEGLYVVGNFDAFQVAVFERLAWP